MDEEWQTATGGKRRRRRAGAAVSSGLQHAGPQAVLRLASSQTPTERQVQRCCAAVEAAAAELAAAPFWQHLSQQLAQLPEHCSIPRLEHMVVYGLGSLEQPAAVHIRYQLAAACLVARLLPLVAPAEAFDPVFTALDRAVLQHCTIQVLSHDEGGRRLARRPTLFFMPHCEAVLMDALLVANLAAGTLHNVVVLGNRFSGYHASWALRGSMHQQADGGDRLPQRPATMLRLCDFGAVRELQVDECSFPVASAFNDLALHSFPLDAQQRLQAAGES